MMLDKANSRFGLRRRSILSVQWLILYDFAASGAAEFHFPTLPDSARAQLKAVKIAGNN